MDLNILHEFNNPSSIIYFFTLTTIFIVFLFYGNTLIFETTTDKYAHFCYAFLLIFIYVIFLGVYYLKWTFEGILLMLLVFSVLLGLAAFVILYFGDQICKRMEEKGESQIWRYLLLALGIAILVLTFYHRKGTYEWYDMVKFILILIILRVMYYIVRKEDYQYVKTGLDLFLAYIMYREGKKIYEIWKGV